MGKLIKRILHIPSSPQIQPPSCSTNLTNAQTISSFQKWSSFLHEKNTLNTPTVLNLPDSCSCTLKITDAIFLSNWTVLDKNDSSLMFIKRTSSCYCSTSLFTSQFYFHIQCYFTGVAWFLCQNSDGDEVPGHSYVFSWKKKLLYAICMWRVWQMKIEKYCQWGKCLILEKVLCTNAIDLRERKPQKQQGNNTTVWVYTHQRKGNSELTSICLLIIHHNRMKYADVVSFIRLRKKYKFPNQIYTNE